MSIYFLNYHNSQYYYILINYKYEYYLSQKSMAGCFERTVMADNRESDRMNLDVDWQHNWIGGFRIEPEIRDDGRSENLEGLGLLKENVLLLFRQKSGGGHNCPSCPLGSDGPWDQHQLKVGNSLQCKLLNLQNEQWQCLEIWLHGDTFMYQ